MKAAPVTASGTLRAFATTNAARFAILIYHKSRDLAIKSRDRAIKSRDLATKSRA
jgi:hypothetical protein